jgi:hemerythrin HHE cation binding domain-containing protein
MPSATQLIRRDHKKVDGLFNKFTETKKPDGKQRICEQVIQELEIHAKLEEEIFYPAVRKHVGEEDMLEEAKQEHQQAKEIMRELKKMKAGDEQFEDKFSELVEGVKHHVEEEEGEMLPKAEESEMDLQDIGEQMTERREELLEQMQSKSAPPKSGGGRKPKSSGRRKSGRAA